MSREHDKILKEKVLHILLLGDIHVNGRFTDERNVKKLPPTARYVAGDCEHSTHGRLPKYHRGSPRLAVTG